MLDFEPTNTYVLEYTDTFGGEANYCWVKRRVLTLSPANGDDAKARKRYSARVRRGAKRAIGLTGVRGEWTDYGDMMEFRPRNLCTVLFVTWTEGE